MILKMKIFTSERFGHMSHQLVFRCSSMLDVLIAPETTGFLLSEIMEEKKPSASSAGATGS